MKLLSYVKTIPVAERPHFARRCGTSLGHLLNIAYGYKKSSAELSIAIERESSGSVTAEEMRPDVHWHVIRRIPDDCDCHESTP